MKGGALWEPLCCVQIIGLLVATLVTKVVAPMLYVLFVEDFKLINRSRTLLGRDESYQARRRPDRSRPFRGPRRC